MLFKTGPTIDMTKYINSIKGVGSRILFQEFPEIKMELWKGHLLSTSYCLLTTAEDSKLLFQTALDILKKYVEYQGNDGEYNNGKMKIDNKCNLCVKTAKAVGW